MNDEHQINDNKSDISKPTAKDSHFILDDNFNQLLKVQETIYQQTQVKPSIKKLVNLIISEANFEDITNNLIKAYQ